MLKRLPRSRTHPHQSTPLQKPKSSRACATVSKRPEKIKVSRSVVSKPSSSLQLHLQPQPHSSSILTNPLHTTRSIFFSTTPFSPVHQMSAPEGQTNDQPEKVQAAQQQQPQQNQNQRPNLSPEEIAAKREERKKAQQDRSANKKTKPDQPQQPAKKPTSTNNKDFSSVYTKSFPNHTYEYVDTHVHIDAILGRLNRAAAQKEKGETPAPLSDDCCTPSTAPTQATPVPASDPTSKAPVWTVDRLNTESHLGNFGGAVTVCCEPESYQAVMKVLETDSSGKIFGAFGVHPHEASKWTPKVEAAFEKAMEHPKVIAWGECGLDYYYEHSPKEAQKTVFIRQIELAVKHKKPLVVHTREAEEDTLEIMLKHVPKEHFVHIHCCTSSVKMVKPLLDHFPNLYVGFTGCITFKNNEQIIESLSLVPLNRLLLETDGPYMAPMPFRGATAHSGMIPFTAIRMAEVKQVGLEELMVQVRANTKSIYGF